MTTPCSRLSFLVVHPDGTAEQYDYASGAYSNNADGSQNENCCEAGAGARIVVQYRHAAGSVPPAGRLS